MLRVFVSISSGLSALVAVLVGIEASGGDLPTSLMYVAVALDAFSGAALARYVLSEPAYYE